MNDITALMATMKAAAEKATPGEWCAFSHPASGTYAVHTPKDKRCEDVIKWPGFDGQQNAAGNAEFIAAANPDNVKTLVEELEKAQAITAAAEKLVRCKGRYHSEQNYRALAALFGVNTPDLPPLDGESRTVTVKLRDINEYLAVVHDKTLRRALRLTAEGVREGDIAAMTAAGIQVIEGE